MDSFMAIQSLKPLTGAPVNINADPYFNKQEPQTGAAPFANYFKQALFGLNESALDMAGNYVQIMANEKGAPSLHHATIAESEGEIMFKLATAFVSKATSTATMLFQMQF